MALKAWEKFQKNTKFLKEILDSYDDLKAENTELKAEIRKLKAKKVNPKVAELRQEIADKQRAIDDLIEKNLMWQEEHRKVMNDYLGLKDRKIPDVDPTDFE